MRNKTFILFLMLSPLFLTLSCNDDDNDDITIESSPIIAQFNFDIRIDLNDWQFDTNDSAEMIIDSQDKIEGAGSLNIHKGCSSIIYQEGIVVEKESIYEFSLFAKNIKMPDGSHCGGAYNMALVVIQGDEQEWFSIYQESEDWYNVKYNYQTNDTGLPIQLRIYCGVQDLWIDHLVIEKE